MGNQVFPAGGDIVRILFVGVGATFLLGKFLESLDNKSIVVGSPIFFISLLGILVLIAITIALLKELIKNPKAFWILEELKQSNSRSTAYKRDEDFQGHLDRGVDTSQSMTKDAPIPPRLTQNTANNNPVNSLQDITDLFGAYTKSSGQIDFKKIGSEIMKELNKPAIHSQNQKK